MIATSTTNEEEIEDIEQRAIDVIESVGEGDQILFNDRKQPLEVYGKFGESHRNTWLKLKGPQGGYYKLQHRDGRTGNIVSIGRETGFDENGIPTYDYFDLTDVEIVNRHEFRVGQLFEVHDSPFDEVYHIVSDVSGSNVYDVEVVQIRVEDGEVVDAEDDSGYFVDRAKRKIFDGERELVKTFDFGYARQGTHVDNDRDERVRLSDPHARGVDLRPVDGHGLEVVDWETILFGFSERFEKVE